VAIELVLEEKDREQDGVWVCVRGMSSPDLQHPVHLDEWGVDTAQAVVALVAAAGGTGNRTLVGQPGEEAGTSLNP
jgi:hypothetical protein